jgi:hypothetical protein
MSSELYIVLTVGNYNNNNNDYDKRSYDIKDNEQSGKTNWWFNELDSLGIKNNNDIGIVSNDQSSRNSSNKTKSVSSQELEDLTDDIKQRFIRDYKTCYSK